MNCRSCLSGLDHCHGMLVVHENGDLECTLECTQPCADLDEARHRLLLSCAEIDGGCRCAVEVSAGELARVS